jgi:ATP:cob(I)alamin adenosyltransferase
MSIYTKQGDNGVTSLKDSRNISKSDDRIQLIGNIDELTSNLGLVKASYPKQDIKLQVEQIQKNLQIVMAGIADQYNRNYKLKEEEVEQLEKEIDSLQQLFPPLTAFVLPGDNTLSAQIDIARTITRRAERWMNGVAKKYSVDNAARKYMNRLSDYLFTLARYTDYLLNPNQSNSNQHNSQKGIKGEKLMSELKKNELGSQIEKNAIIDAVIHKLDAKNNKITLDSAKKLIDKIEVYAREQGMSAVIAVTNPEGNPVAVHVMDGAFLASFDIAMKKAYTSVAVKMSTKELAKLAMPGETFYGIDKADNGRMTIIGGGIPLCIMDHIAGGLGISGGTAEEDSKIAEYGLHMFREMFK